MRTTKILVPSIALFGGVFALMSCTPGENPNNGGDDSTLKAIRGLEYFSRNGCASCHCNDAVGGCNLDAPNIQNMPENRVDLMLRSAQVTRAHPVKLPATDQEIEDVATFLGTLGNGQRLNGNSLITQGYNLYVQAGCVTCHLASAQGVLQGGLGQAIAGTDPDNVYAALSGLITCHPLQGTIPDDVPAECTLGVTTNPTVQQLTDTAPPDADNERTKLSYFLAFIAPPPKVGVVEECENVSGEICTVAGNGISGFTGDDVPSREALLYSPLRVALTDWNVDGTLDLCIDDWNNHRIRMVYLDKETEGKMDRITSIAGTGKVTGDDALNHPSDVAFDADGGLVMANWHNQNMYRYPRNLVNGGDRDQLAGLCDLQCSADNPEPTSVIDTFLALPIAVSIHPNRQHIYISEQACSRIRLFTFGSGRERVQPAGCITPVNLWTDSTLEIVAGKGGMNGYEGDGGPASEAVFNINNTPVVPNFGSQLSVENPPRYLYVCDSGNHIIRAIDLSVDPPTIELFAGVPQQSGFKDGPGDQALFNFPANVDVDAAGNLYISDWDNHAVRKIDPVTREVTTIAGTGVRGYNGDNLPAKETQLGYPGGVAVHPDGRIFIADSDNNRVRVIIP